MKKILLLLSLVLLLIPFQALAFNKDQRFEIERQQYYDPTDCGGGVTVPGYASPTGASLTSGNKVYILGDSITARSAETYKSQFTSKNISPTISAVSGRSWVSPGNPGVGATGTLGTGKEAVAADSAAIAAANGIIIALGTNGYGGSNPINEIITTIKAINPSAPIWWVNVANGPPGNAAVPAFNTQLSQASSGKFTVIPWDKTVDPNGNGTNNPQGILDDGTHPSIPSGVNTLVTQVVTAVTSGSTSTSADSASSIISNQCCKSSIGGSTTLTGSDNAQKVFNYLTGKGLTPTQAAGIMGNLQAESGFRSDIIQGGGTAPEGYVPQNGVGFGLAQWTFTGRQQPLVNLANSQGKPVTDLGVQLDYLWQELNSGYKTRVLDPLKATASLEEATNLFLEKFEVPADIAGNRLIRLGFANKILDLYGGGSSAVNIGSSNTNGGGSCGSSVNASGSATAIVAFAEKEFLASQAGPYDISKFNGHPGAWCADFVSYVLKETGTPFTGGTSGGWQIPSVQGVQQFLQAKNQWHPKGQGFEPKPGDIVIYNEGQSPYPQHVNIVVSVEGGGRFTTIGGNEGGKVSKNTHTSYDASYITGYGRIAN
jgi:hypothetical protein